MRLTVEKKRPARMAMPSACASRRGPTFEEGNSADLLEHMVCVRHIARRIHRKLPVHVEFEDLVSAGALGLVDACRRFDRSRHVQFKSFAQFRIRGAILDWLRMADWGPRALRTKQRLAASAIDVLTRRLGRPPAENEVAAELHMELAEYQELARELNSLKIESLDAKYTMDSTADGVEFVAAGHADDPLARLLEGETRQMLADAMEALPERERLVLRLYFHEDLTLKEIGLILGVVESRVSQIRAEAIGRLRARFGVRSIAQENHGRFCAVQRSGSAVLGRQAA